jgi:exodeoxyribonuclease V beta subunit
VKPLEPLELPLKGVQLIEASAGTGKTFTITTLVLRLLLEERLGIEQVLVVTFTNAATAELRQRIRLRLTQAARALETGIAPGDPDLERLVLGRTDRVHDRQLLLQAVRDLDQASIFTIHGFCQRALQEHAFESGNRFELELTADDRPLMSEVVRDFWATQLYAASQAKLSYLNERSVRLATFEQLARIAVGWPRLRVVPPRPAAIDPEPELARYFRARARVAAAWPTAREQVRALLSDPALSGTRYRPALLDGYCAQLTELLASSEQTLTGAFERLDKFTTRALQQATKSGQRTPEHSFIELCDELYDAFAGAKSSLDTWLLGLEHDFMTHVPTELRRRKRQRGVQSFDDLLQDLATALEGPAGERLASRIRARYPAALIDEFQDTDPLQYEIFQAIYGRGSTALLLIGDPKQAIYAFRGADVFAYLNAAHDAAGAYTLGTNRRSDPQLLAALGALFSRVSAPFLLEEITFSKVVAPDGASDRLTGAAALEIVFLEREGRGKEDRITKTWAAHHLPRVVAGEVSRLLHSSVKIDGRDVVPGDVAILTRTNRQALDIQRELRLLRVPSVLHGDASVLDSEEAGEVGYVLRALADPSRRSAIRAALATPLFGLDASALYALRDDEAAWESWVERFRRWHGEWVDRGFIQAFRSVLREQNVSARLLGLIGGERRLTNVLHLSELLHRAACEHHLGVSGLLQWFDEIRCDEASREGLAPDALQIRLESDERAVQLTTMHRSKGLEYPIVLCPQLWDGTVLRGSDRVHPRYHDPETRELVLDLCGAKENKALAEHEAHAENLRLLYVAVTRAKHHLIVFWGAFKSYETSPFAHLVHQGEDGQPAAQRLKVATDDQVLADLQRLARDAGSGLQVRTYTEAVAKPYSPSAAPRAALAARTVKRRVESAWRNSSFSALVMRSDHGRLSATPDHDAHADAVDASSSEAADAMVVPLDAFPRGTSAGEALHAVLERVDFTAFDATADAVLSPALQRHGIDAATWTDIAKTALADLVRTPLRESCPLKLSDVTLTERLNELEFVIPIVREAAPDGRLGAAALAEVFAKYARADDVRAYAQRLAKLSFVPVAGFLRGFIDLVFRSSGKWYVVDYKSNHLGPRAADYAPQHLRQAMSEHHYYLQYHLYVLAVHRELRRRAADYDYERDFGAVLYLFLRGMRPVHGAGCGVFEDRPPIELIEALSKLFDGTGGCHA